MLETRMYRLWLPLKALSFFLTMLPARYCIFNSNTRKIQRTNAFFSSCCKREPTPPQKHVHCRRELRIEALAAPAERRLLMSGHLLWTTFV